MKSIFPLVLLLAVVGRITAAETHASRVATVTNTPGCVAFWDFVTREPDGARRFTAQVPPGTKHDFALDAANYVRDYWGEGREATYADFPVLGRGPFGNAIRIRKEDDPNFRPHDLYTPANDGSGGPFTIGRVIHSSRSVGFTGWIGGVAVFNRALTAEELGKLASLTKAGSIPRAEQR
jgi:hypothetical protein